MVIYKKKLSIQTEILIDIGIFMNYSYPIRGYGSLAESDGNFLTEEISQEEYPILTLVDKTNQLGETKCSSPIQADHLESESEELFLENDEELYSDPQSGIHSSLVTYFKTINRFRLLSEEEERILAKRIKENEEKFKNLVIKWNKIFKKDFIGGFSTTHMKAICKKTQQVNGTFHLFDDLIRLERERKKVNRALKRLSHRSNGKNELQKELYKVEAEISKCIAQMNLTKSNIKKMKQVLKKISNDKKRTKRHQFGEQELRRMLREISHTSKEIKTAKNELVQANLRIVISIAKKYCQHGIPLSDLIQEGNLGLIRAIDTYDYRRGHRFITYATWWIRQAVLRVIDCHSRTIRTPVYIREKMNQILKVSNRLLQEYKRKPTLEEIANATNIPSETIEKVTQSFTDSLSIDTSFEENGKREIKSSLNHKNNSILEQAISSNLSQIIDLILSNLTQREREIVKLRFGIGERHDHTLEEIGKRFKVSRERIRQILEKTLGKLKTPNNVRNLKEFIEFNGSCLANDAGKKCSV